MDGLTASIQIAYFIFVPQGRKCTAGSYRSNILILRDLSHKNDSNKVLKRPF
jgi:hypothetical protein